LLAGPSDSSALHFLGNYKGPDVAKGPTYNVETLQEAKSGLDSLFGNTEDRDVVNILE
jgi:hypothetical protein